jgi:hypothetical protein
MKKFILHILLFLVPLVIGGFVFFSMPTNTKRAYHYLTDDCEGRGAWIYRRVFELKRPIDIAFLGSSHTINGINDTLINQQLMTDSLPPISVCNLGYCRLGRDLTYVMMKHIIQQKNTKTFIIEVLPDENPFSHPVFPFLADIKDVVNPQTIVNRSYPNNLYNAAISRIMYFRQDLFKDSLVYKYGLREEFGFSTNAFTADTNQLNQNKIRRIKNQGNSFTWTRRINLPLSRKWLANINTLAINNGVKIIFLYIPPYGSPEKTPIEMDTYLSYGEVWIAPDSIFTNKKNWYDQEHLNVAGAYSLSTWVANQLKDKNLN